LSDKKGRKPFIATGLLCYALISIAFVFIQSVGGIITIRLLQGIASAMIMPVVQAYVGDITPKGREGVTMGFFHMSLFFGMSIGPIVGGIINERFSLSAAFVCMGALALSGFLLSLFLLPPTRTESVVCKNLKPASWKQLLKDRGINGLSLFRFAYTACIGIIWGFLPVFADSEFSLSSSQIGMLLTLGIFISGILHVPMGKLADVLNKRFMVLFGGVVISGATISFLYASNLYHLMISSVIFGIGGGVSIPALMALSILKGSETRAMGSVMSLLTMAHSLGMLFGALLAGVMMDLTQLRQVFPVGAVLMMTCTIAFYFLTGHPNIEKRN